jgi:CrcB protein
MNSLVLVSIGGVAGTLTRYGLGEIFPNDRTGTLIANIIGAGLAAALLVWMERRGVTQLRLLLLPGFCAGMTTFSAVTAQSLEPLEGGFIFLIQNVSFSLLAVVLILPLARKVIPVRK